MRRNGGMDDDGGAMPPKNEVQAPIGKSKCEEKIICLHSPPSSNGSSIWLQRQMQQAHIWCSPHA